MLAAAAITTLDADADAVCISLQHGGGYAYRIAPADGPLTEETFGKLPVDFVGNSILRWDGNYSTQIEFNTSRLGWETREGTVPPGSMWRKNPMYVLCTPALMQLRGTYPTFGAVR